MININGGTKAVCLIGNPVIYSLSPFIHNYGFGLHNVNSVYLAHHVEDNSVKEAVYGIKGLNYIGCNVTYPHKTSVIPFLDELTEEAKLIGAVNTIKNVNGKLVGYNTDGIGFINGLKNKGFDLNGKNICILGAGGAARSIIVSLIKEYRCNVIVCNRNINKAIEISNGLNKYSFSGTISECIEPSQLKSKDIDVLINCTPVGMSPNEDAIPFEEDLLIKKDMLVCDLIYKPYETKLLKKAKEIGCQVHYGLDMLLFQAIVAFKIWTDKDIPFGELEILLKRQIY
ncbi:shikimate dehydrogenase [Serpentinicella alkaliphila]|uniref:Shikimate dehydrogenase (NADP(+)) n=1 Tax=Serpentinicella alkaliphila TaxID=1734049 RepID=A0A4R2TZ09_9FIRM|nr:shikimate dehydrogenase [Serpentinicella alkaliphila]QUH26669.1 shikimate dehydrogenase [Serpentinicella alkaliphila]TCQ00533.1 shikimate dehydrogenase [Serpentinicella alkaliphila]